MKSEAIINRIKVIFAACAWGTMGYFVRYIDLPTSVIACARGFIGAVFLYVFGIITTKSFRVNWNIIKANLPVLCLSGTALGCNWIFLFESYRRTSVAISTLCYYLAPVIVMIVSVFLFHEKMTVRKLICMVAALFGMVLISGILTNNFGNGYGADGMICALIAAVLYATVTITGKFTKGLSANQETMVKLFIASIILVPYNLLTVDFNSLHPSSSMIIMLILLGIIPTGGAFAAYFSAIHSLDAQVVALYTYLDPVVAILVSVVLLHEGMNWNGIIGSVLLISALILFEMFNKESKATYTPAEETVS